MATGHKLVEDLREVPSWVWLGGAAGLGLLWILRGHAAQQAATQQTTGNQPNPIATGQGVSTLQDYGNYQLYSDLESKINQLLQQQQNPLPTPGTNNIPNPTYPFMTPGQGPNFTPGPYPGAAGPAYQQPGLGATNWGIEEITSNNQQAGIFAYNFQDRQVYQYQNGSWQTMTQDAYSAFVNAHPGSVTATGYRGPGEYFGQVLNPIPSPNTS